MLLTGIITVSVPGAVFAASTEKQIADVQAQKEAAQAELAQQQSNMASLESKKQELESYLEELNAQYTDLTNSVSELGIQAAEKEEQLKTLNTQLEEAKATADKQYQDMKKRIVYMYENGSASMLELLCLLYTSFCPRLLQLSKGTNPSLPTGSVVNSSCAILYFPPKKIF